MSSGGKSFELLPSGPAITVSPANCDVAVHIDEKTVKLAASGFSSVSRSSLSLNTCVFLGSVSPKNSTVVIDVYADRYDAGHVGKHYTTNNLFPEPSVCLGQDDVVIPCFLNRRISKAELKELSLANLVPPMDERNFAPSLRDIIACCISLQLSVTTNSPRSSAPNTVTRADLRISLPTNTANFTPVKIPSQLFGGIAVTDLLPPTILSQGRQVFRSGYVTLRPSTNRLASWLGFVLDSEVMKQPENAEPNVVGIWVSGNNLSPAEDLRIYAACMRYAFDRQLVKRRLMPSFAASHRSPAIPLISTQNTPFFLVAVVNNVPRQAPSVNFYECRISPALQPTFTILTATTLLPPPSVSGDRSQKLKLDFILGRAASAIVEGHESFNESADDHQFEDDETDYVSEPPSAMASFRRKPPPQPQQPPAATVPTVPDVSLWLSPTVASAKTKTLSQNPDSVTTLSTPRNGSDMRMHMPISEIRVSGNKSSGASVSDFEDEWRAMRQKVEVMWQHSAQPPKLSSTLISQTTTSIEATSVITSPPQTLRASVFTTNTKLSETSSDSQATARTLRDACVGVGTSLLMLNSPRSTVNECPNHLADIPKLNLGTNPVSSACSQCCSRDDLISTSSKATRKQAEIVDQGCCLPRSQKPAAAEPIQKIKEKQTKSPRKAESLVADEKDAQYDPCSLILKWLQRCGNDTAASSVCGDTAGPSSHSRCSSYDDNVKTAAAICTYLNGDSTIKNTRIEEQHSDDSDDDDENQFVSLSASSTSMILKTDDVKVVQVKSSSGASHSDSRIDSNCWGNGADVSLVSEKRAGNSDSFAARAREIVRQMDEWGLAPQIRSQESSVDTSNDLSHVVQYDQVRAALERGRFKDPGAVSSSIDSVSSRNTKRSSGNRVPDENQQSFGNVNFSIALPRVVALESLRLGPTNTTLVMKNLASKHLQSFAPGADCSSDAAERPRNQKPPIKASVVNYTGHR